MKFACILFASVLLATLRMVGLGMVAKWDGKMKAKMDQAQSGQKSFVSTNLARSGGTTSEWKKEISHWTQAKEIVDERKKAATKEAHGEVLTCVARSTAFRLGYLTLLTGAMVFLLFVSEGTASDKTFVEDFMSGVWSHELYLPFVVYTPASTNHDACPLCTFSPGRNKLSEGELRPSCIGPQGMHDTHIVGMPQTMRKTK